MARAPADGYTLLLGNIATFAINVGIYKKMPYDPIRDLAPIAKTVAVNYVLVVNPKVPARNAAELVAYAKAHPGKLTYGSSGSGSAQHMAAELFKARTGTQILHIPYKGTGELIADLLAGHVDMIFADQGTMMQQVSAGKLRVLGVCGPQRSADYPDIPTVAEAAGIPGFEVVAWQGSPRPPEPLRTSCGASTPRSTRYRPTPPSAGRSTRRDSRPTAARPRNSGATSKRRSASGASWPGTWARPSIDRPPMTISRIDAWVFRAPIDRPVRAAVGTLRDRPALFIRLTDDDGATGWGKCSAISRRWARNTARA